MPTFLTNRSHLRRDGRWVHCDDYDCSLPFHVNMTPRQAAAMPSALLEPLFEAAQPPTRDEPGLFGVKEWRDADNELHRDFGLPAVILGGGTRYWYRHGQKHREHGPATVSLNGSQGWWQYGLRHRDGGLPAVITENGARQEWWVRGSHARPDDLPVVVDGGVQEWRNTLGHLHRENDLPALVDAVGVQEWFHHGQRHREGGKPAVIHHEPGGMRITRAEYWENGVPLRAEVI